MNPASNKELQLRVHPVDDDEEQPPRQDFEFYMEGEMECAVQFEQGAIPEIWERLLAACQTTKLSCWTGVRSTAKPTSTRTGIMSTSPWPNTETGTEAI